MREETYLCAKCRELQSYAYNDFDEVVSYVHCQCKKPKPLESDKDKLNKFFNEMDKYFHKTYDSKRRN